MRLLPRLAIIAPLALFGAHSGQAQTAAFGAQPALAGAFGGSVVVLGADVLVGEPNNQMRSGLVYVYRKDAKGKWVERAQLAAKDGYESDGFGSALGAEGNTLLVGAARMADSKGAAYLFTRSKAGEWTQAAKLSPGDLAEGDAFGAAGAVSGDLALVAAPGQSDRAGAVYVFRRGADGKYAQEAKLTGSVAKQALFGAAVATDGKQAFIGMPGHNERTGVVLVFTRDGASWKESARLTSSMLEKNDRFGLSLALRGDELAVGAPLAGGGVGAVFLFHKDAKSGAWQDATRLVAYDGSRSDNFGTAVALADQAVWVSAPRAGGYNGAVYAFRRESADSGVINVGKVVAAEAERGDQFGGALDVSGNIAAVGMTGDDYGAGTVVILESAGESGPVKQTAMLKSPPEHFASVTGKEVKCSEEGEATRFSCSNVDLLSFVSVPDMGGKRGIRLNDIWGWTDPQTGHEYALVGRSDGTSFVDISNPENPRYVGDLPKTREAQVAVWRDIKVYKDHAFIVADGSGPHGMQVFDLTRLRAVKGAPVTFTEDAHYDKINSAHNIVINEESGYAYAVGASAGGETCGGGLHMIDIREPEKPVFAGCFADPETGRASTGYTHDAQCVMYHGPDSTYTGHEICMGANETALSIADVTDKKNPKALSRAGYPNVGYSHQGWFTEDQRYFYMDDELDEINGSVKNTRTLIWDVADLDDPQLVGEFLGSTEASDHNLYVLGNLMYQSDYQAGLRVVDISDRKKPVEIGYFDTVPYGTNTPGFGGSWSNYPFFKSGVVIVTSGNEGLFILKKREGKPIS
jgi:choice-of-anchor B domain-containing protein